MNLTLGRLWSIHHGYFFKKNLGKTTLGRNLVIDALREVGENEVTSFLCFYFLHIGGCVRVEFSAWVLN